MSTIQVQAFPTEPASAQLLSPSTSHFIRAVLKTLLSFNFCLKPSPPPYLQKKAKFLSKIFVNWLLLGHPLAWHSDGMHGLWPSTCCCPSLTWQKPLPSQVSYRSFPRHCCTRLVCPKPFPALSPLLCLGKVQQQPWRMETG